MLTGAGADRMQSGMKKSFGKPVGIAARVNAGDEIFVVGVEKQGVPVAKVAFKKIKAKVPFRSTLEIKRIGG